MTIMERKAPEAQHAVRSRPSGARKPVSTTITLVSLPFFAHCDRSPWMKGRTKSRYAVATGIYAAQSDLLRNSPLCDNTCTMTLGLGNLANGTYEITAYHHTTQFGPNGSPGVPARAIDPFDIALTDGVVTNRVVAAGVEESDNASPAPSTATFEFTVSGGSPVEINLLRPVNTASMHITLAAVDIEIVIPEPGTFVLLLFGAVSFLSVGRRRGSRGPQA